MTDNTIKIICRKCETVFVAAKLPMDVSQLAAGIKKSSCPNCGDSALKGHIWTGEKKHD